MRSWEFGIFDSQHAAWDCANYGFFRSILAADDGSTTDQEGTPTYNDTGNPPKSIGSNININTDHASNLIRVAKAQIQAKLGQIPVLVNVSLGFVPAQTDTNRVRVYAILDTAGIDLLDSTNRYKDKSALSVWYEDTYAPYPGKELAEEPTGDTVSLVQLTNGSRFYISVTDIVERALRDNTDIWFYVWPRGSTTNVFWNAPDLPHYRHTLLFSYFYPVEFYKDDGAGSIDLAAIIGDTDETIYYIGAVERGQTGSAVKGHVRNMSGAAINLEIFDDHPEYRTPIQKVGSGTGQLDDVELLDPAVSQLYTVIFYTSTEYEIKAEAYRDNVVSLHPQIDADSSWRGNTSTTFTAPSGGFRIPADAWQPGTLTADEIEVAVRGNTTDTSWPPDSNDQVEITSDDTGAPDAAGWRPVAGRREFTRATVDVDATTKFFPTRRVAPAEWPTSTPAFVQDADSIDEGTVSSVQEAALGAVTYSGGGLDDFSRSGNYNGNENRDYRVRIDATGTPDTFEWSNDGGGAYQATDIAITGGLQLLEDGVYILFTATTGHTLTDYWDFAADTFGIELAGLTAGANSYTAGAVVGTTLPIRGIAAAIFSSVSAASGFSEPNPARIFLTSTAGFTQGDTIYIQQAGTNLAETREIATGGVTSTYIDVTVSLVNDYAEGDFCTKIGVGDAPFWLRPVATGVTVEELKTLRLNARII